MKSTVRPSQTISAYFSDPGPGFGQYVHKVAADASVEGRLSAQNHCGVARGVLASNRHSFTDPWPGGSYLCSGPFVPGFRVRGRSAGDAFRDVPGRSAGMWCLAEALWGDLAGAVTGPRGPC